MIKECIIKSCRLCGRLFRYYGHGYEYCEECTAIDNKMFYQVKEYIWEHETASETEVSEALGISLNQIYSYLQERRLEIPENSPIYTRCERCRKEIRYGRYCDGCQDNLVKLKNYYKEQGGLQNFPKK